ncbi:SRPBCC family protein [Streptomyces sp. V4-01]|uniref:SRPBCC family protein n=1 Tax=Actinacidiphila polyblastidii TaxID=3110430 RepID=A0ABU7PKG7_9ACTN|nr:SRPBCC family protein [Streptomyces sp. V4-01]
MVHVSRSFTVNRPLPDVVAYLADFGHAVDWDPGTQECVRTAGQGAPVEGARWRNVSVFRGRRTELDYTLDRREERRVTFTGVNKTAHSTDDFVFETSGGGTRVTYSATVRFQGLARLADPFLRKEFERLGDEVTRTLPQAAHTAIPAGQGDGVGESGQGGAAPFDA